ncbi:MAG: hypothetical protein ACTSUE_13680 [Promethearchaeota archaeon]
MNENYARAGTMQCITRTFDDHPSKPSQSRVEGISLPGICAVICLGLTFF